MENIRKFEKNLKSLYEENDYPSDRLFLDPNALSGFAEEFNSRVNERFAAEDVAAELERIRKDKKGTGGLPKLGRSYRGPRFFPKNN